MTENPRPFASPDAGAYDQPGGSTYDQPGAFDQPDPTGQPSTTAVARDQAAAVGQSAADAGGHVAQTAADQAKMVASETARHARDLLGEAGGQARDQAASQQQRAARQLHSVADELHGMASGSQSSGVATEVAHQAAERISSLASWLEQREPADVLQAVRDFARRRPGVFLGGAVAAGLIAGRLTRGVTDAARSDDQPSGRQQYGTPYGSSYGSSYGTPGAAIPPPPDLGSTATVPGYPADTVPGVSTGMVTPGGAGVTGATETGTYYPAAGVPGPGVAGSADEFGEAGEIPPGHFQGGYEPGDGAESGAPEGYPETYRPGGQL